MSAVAPLTRRAFLHASLTATGGLLLGRYAAADVISPGLPAQLGAFVRIEPHGAIIIGARGCEIGQGVKTSLPMLIAEELDAAWSHVRVEQLPAVFELGASGLTSRYGDQGAGGSTSIPDSYEELRRIGATARRMLVDAAAAQWKVDGTTLRTEASHVVHPDGQRLSYQSLAHAAAHRKPPEGDVPLKAAKDFRIIGQPARVADAREIVTGAPLFGLDQHLDGALVAVMLRAPVVGAEIETVNDVETFAIPGVRAVHRIEGPAADGGFAANLAAGVAVLADDTWTAIRGRNALKVEWTTPPAATESSAVIRTRAQAALKRPDPSVVQRKGDLDAARKAAKRTVAATYEQPFLAHATLEPQNAIVHIQKDKALLIAPLQSPGGASQMISTLTGLPREKIEIRLTRVGGGFGRRLKNDFVAEAVRIAQAANKPVKLVWTREDDMRTDWYRPFGVHEFECLLDGNDAVTGWRHRIAATPRKYRDPGMAESPDWTGCHEVDEFPAHLVPAWSHEFVDVAAPLARGWWRAPLPNFIAFPVQSFVDEVAHATKQDPVALRLKMLGAPREIDYGGHGGPKYDTGRLAHVLKLAAERIGWGAKMPEGRGQGIAVHFTFGGYAAHAMEVSVSKTGVLGIHRCVCAVDVGQPVNPLGIEAQMIGGTIDGLSTALGLGITLKDGRVEQGNFDSYPLMRMAQAPDVEVIIVPSTVKPSGAGEMGIPTAAPALCNAIFAATGKRIRTLPIANQLSA